MNNKADHDPESNNVIEAWEDFIQDAVYPTPITKAKADYRNFESPKKEAIRDFYQLNHRMQTVDFVQQKRQTYLGLNRRKMTVFESLDFLNTLVDDSDPDIELDQLQHLLQTAEQIRKDGHEDWFVLTGLVHDLGKMLCLFGEPQWAVVGDTFPVGCRFSKRIVFDEFFAENQDSTDSRYNTQLGTYSRNCGLRNILMSWGHDEYLYHVLKEYLPEPALYMIRFHSFYAWHREDEYDWLCDDHDRQMLAWVRKFNPYDLYSKSPVAPNWRELRPYYAELIQKYLPSELAF
ncbi:MAG: inositol oxygenase family protein [Pirellulaceae bacterium]|nr:inositol oxygenase family protein [Pirellulaceae bacterium]